MKSLIPVGLLVVALVVLATLQYQSIGQISEIERQKQVSSLLNSSNRFVQDFSVEYRELYNALRLRTTDVSQVVARHREWAATAPHANLAEKLYIADADPDVSGLRLREISIERETAEAVAWPTDLLSLKGALEREAEMEPQRDMFGTSTPRFRAGPGDAMVLSIAITPPVGGGGPGSGGPGSGGPGGGGPGGVSGSPGGLGMDRPGGRGGNGGSGGPGGGRGGSGGGPGSGRGGPERPGGGRSGGFGPGGPLGPSGISGPGGPGPAGGPGGPPSGRGFGPPSDPRSGSREGGSSRRPSGWVIARLDRTVVNEEILPDLTARHFPRNDGQGYRVAVVDANNNFKPVYESSGAWSEMDLMTPDRAVDLLGYSGSNTSSTIPGGNNRGRGGGRGPGGSSRGSSSERGSSTERSGSGERGSSDPGRPSRQPSAGFGSPGGFGGGPGGGSPPPGGGSSMSASFQYSLSAGQHWRLLVKNEAGSLEAAVEQARRRNLAVSFGVLLVLGAAALTLMVSGHRARELGKLQMEFAAGVSHELRTPLTVIQSAAHNLRSGVVKDRESVEEYAEIVQKEARRLSGMVDQVMAYAETQSGRRRYDISAIDLNDIVEQAMKTLAFVDDIPVQVDRRIPLELPPALADPGALVQCVQNLITNAVKYGQRDGGVQIEIEAVHDTLAHQIRLSVIDHGGGVPASDVPHLFDAFHRGSNASTSTPGNGIGLHLVKKTMESQNGEVVYADRPGGGASFTLIVPSADSQV